MLIMVSDPALRSDEASLLNTFFSEGLQRLHLRKPGVDEQALAQLLDDIDSRWRPRIALHQHHALAGRFGLQRLHYTTAARALLDASTAEVLRAQGLVLSTSVHSREEALQLPPWFHYAFLGPVHNSISKPGYEALAQAEQVGAATSQVPLVAIGGVSRHNATALLQKGFSGIAVLGTVWQHPDPLQQFRQLQTLCSTTDHL